MRDSTNSIVGISNLDEAKLKLYEYLDIFNALPVGIYRTRLEDGTFLKANPECANLLGYDTVEELKQNATSKDFYYSEQDRQTFIDMLTKQGTLKHFELPLKTRNGQKIWVAITARVHEDKGYLEGSLMDVTQRRGLEEELETYKAAEVANLSIIQEAAQQRCVEIDSQRIKINGTH